MVVPNPVEILAGGTPPTPHTHTRTWVDLQHVIATRPCFVLNCNGRLETLHMKTFPWLQYKILHLIRWNIIGVTIKRPRFAESLKCISLCIPCPMLNPQFYIELKITLPTCKTWFTATVILITRNHVHFNLTLQKFACLKFSITAINGDITYLRKKHKYL
jgi:hypothetical protein